MVHHRLDSSYTCLLPLLSQTGLGTAHGRGSHAPLFHLCLPSSRRGQKRNPLPSLLAEACLPFKPASRPNGASPGANQTHQRAVVRRAHVGWRARNHVHHAGRRRRVAVHLRAYARRSPEPCRCVHCSTGLSFFLVVARVGLNWKPPLRGCAARHRAAARVRRHSGAGVVGVWRRCQRESVGRPGQGRVLLGLRCAAARPSQRGLAAAVDRSWPTPSGWRSSQAKPSLHFHAQWRNRFAVSRLTRTRTKPNDAYSNLAQPTTTSVVVRKATNPSPPAPRVGGHGRPPRTPAPLCGGVQPNPRCSAHALAAPTPWGPCTGAGSRARRHHACVGVAWAWAWHGRAGVGAAARWPARPSGTALARSTARHVQHVARTRAQAAAGNARQGKKKR